MGSQIPVRDIFNRKKFYEICVLELPARVGGPFYPPPLVMERLVLNKLVSACFELFYYA